MLVAKCREQFRDFTGTEGEGEKIPFLRCSWEPNNLLLSAVSSALDLPM